MKIGELIASIRIDNDDAIRGIHKTEAAFSLLDRSILDARGPLDQFMSISNLPLLISGVDAVWQLSGALGAVPAAAGAGALAVGTLKVAMLGFGDAMKVIGDPAAFAERISFMAPAMQDVMKSIQKLVPAWGVLKDRVQDAFWTNINTHIDLLGSKYLPVLNTGMFKTALAMNKGASGVAQFLEESSTVSDVAHSFDNMSVFVSKVAGAFPNLIALLLDFVTVGSDFLPRMGDGFAKLVQRFTDFIDKARESGKLAEWIQAGLDSLRQLGQIAFNVGAIFVSVFNASGQAGSGLLQTLVDLTTKMLTWVRSVEGQEKIRALFEALSHVAFPLLTLIPMITSMIFTLAEIFASLPGLLQAIIGGFLGWAGIMGFVIVKLIPLISLLLAVKGATIATVATSIAGWVAMSATALAHAALIAGAWLIAIAPIALVIGAVIGLAALIIWKWDEIKAITLAVWDAVWGFIRAVWDFIMKKVAEGVAFVIGKIDWLQALPGKVAAWFGRMRDAAIGQMQALVGWMAGLPGRLVGALGNVGRMLWDAGRRIIQGLIDGIMAMIGAVGRAIGSVVRHIRDALPFSPARWGPLSGRGSPELAGRQIGHMLAAGINSSLTEVNAATVNLGIAASLDKALARLNAPGNQVDSQALQDALHHAVVMALDKVELIISGAGIAKLANQANKLNTRRIGGF